MTLSLSAYFLLFFQLCICVPLSNSQLQRQKRSNETSNHINSPLFNINVLSAGRAPNDPPNFRTKVYIPPTTTSNSNLTNRQIMGERRILSCKSSTATFHHSHCRHMKGVAYSVREYIAWCREPLPTGAPRPTFTLPSEARAMASSTGREDPTLHGDIGACELDEVCVDSLYSVDYREGFVLIANCVKKKLFQDAGLWNDKWDNLEDREGENFWEYELGGKAGDQAQSIDTSSSGLDDSSDEGVSKQPSSPEGTKKHASGFQQQSNTQYSPSILFSGKYASVVVTRDEDGTTPLEVQELELKSLGNGTSTSFRNGKSDLRSQQSGTVAADSEKKHAGTQYPVRPSITEQERNCTYCVDLKTFNPFSPNTEALEMEVKLIGMGSAALAGVMWVALLSG